MRSRTFGRLGWQVSEIGHGLWGAGGWTGSDDAESIAAMQRSMALGCTFYDTALSYGDGKSERLLGRALKGVREPGGQGVREPGGQGIEGAQGARVRVATKVPPRNLQWPAAADARLEDVFPADHIRASTETSLANLGIDAIDLQQFHVWTDRWADDDRWQRAVDDLKREGLVRAIGISVGRLDPAGCVRALRTGLIDAVQVVYNLFDRTAEDVLFPVCRELGIAVIARVPFDEGSLTGTLSPEMTWPDGDFRNSYFAPEKLLDTCRRVDLVREDLPAGMTMPELALRFVLCNQDVTTIIPGMRRPRHVDANLAVSDGVRLPGPLLDQLKRHRRTL
jgi:aryl-alcohol dehydrogenase-like predicted oxidoreductase